MGKENVVQNTMEFYSNLKTEVRFVSKWIKMDTTFKHNMPNNEMQILQYYIYFLYMDIYVYTTSGWGGCGDVQCKSKNI